MRNKVICLKCKKKFIDYKNRKFNYCSKKCYLEADKSCIYNQEFKNNCSKLMIKRWRNKDYRENQVMKRKGKSTWNKGSKGICKPNSGSFKAMIEHQYWKNNGSWYYWHQQARKKLKKLGFDINNKVIHHKDGNFRNNNFNNLSIMDRQSHAKFHYIQYWEGTKNGRRN